MSKSKNTSLSDWNKKGLIMVGNGLVKSEDLVDPNPIKIEPFAPISENKKIRNATKTVVDGVKFDSLLEKYMYDLLRGAKIEFEFQKVYVLQEKFRYGKEAVRAITLTVDFFVPLLFNEAIIIDTKGFANDVAPLKMKLLKRLLYDHYENHYYAKLPKIEIPKNKKEAELLLNRLLYDDKYKH